MVIFVLGWWLEVVFFFRQTVKDEEWLSKWSFLGSLVSSLSLCRLFFLINHPPIFSKLFFSKRTKRKLWKRMTKTEETRCCHSSWLKGQRANSQAMEKVRTATRCRVLSSDERSGKIKPSALSRGYHRDLSLLYNKYLIAFKLWSLKLCFDIKYCYNQSQACITALKIKGLLRCRKCMSARLVVGRPLKSR